MSSNWKVVGFALVDNDRREVFVPASALNWPEVQAATAIVTCDQEQSVTGPDNDHHRTTLFSYPPGQQRHPPDTR
jgi:hypothetical protein